jgi:hypothetical protein
MIFTPADFRMFAEECFATARRCRSDETRQIFLDMAQMWMTAAVRVEEDSASKPTKALDTAA